jgi:hypothetical protein
VSRAERAITRILQAAHTTHALGFDLHFAPFEFSPVGAWLGKKKGTMPRVLRIAPDSGRMGSARSPLCPVSWSVPCKCYSTCAVRFRVELLYSKDIIS